MHPNAAIERLMGFAKSRGYFNTTVDIEASSPVTLPSGQKSHVWGPVAGLDQIDAHIAPPQPNEEIKRADGTTVVDARVITLRGYFPAIDQEMSVVASGRRWGIIAVMHDGQRAYTKLNVEAAT